MSLRIRTSPHLDAGCSTGSVTCRHVPSHSKFNFQVGLRTDHNFVDQMLRLVDRLSRALRSLSYASWWRSCCSAKDDFEQLQNHNGSSRTSRDDFEETDESALVDTAHAITARLALLRTALAVRLQVSDSLTWTYQSH
jgi:hypothetical protein